MASLNSAKRNTTGEIDAGNKAYARVLDFIADFGTDFTMVSDTDDISLATLPAGTIVLAATLQQVTPGTGVGSMVVRIGTTTVTGTLVSPALAGAVSTMLPAALPLVVPAGGLDVNLLGSTATRTDGSVRVVITVVEGDREPRRPTTVARDVI